MDEAGGVGGEDPADRRWVEPALLTVPGVADVNPFGGGEKQYIARVDPALLRAYDVTLPQVVQALENGNSNGGGSVIALGDQEYTVRSVGLLDRPGQASEVVVTQRNGTPVKVGQVARIEKGTSPRRASRTTSRLPATGVCGTNCCT